MTTDEILSLRRVLREMSREDLELYCALNSVVAVRLCELFGITDGLWTTSVPSFSEDENDRMMAISRRVAEQVGKSIAEMN